MNLIIEKKIFLEPKYFDENILDHLQKKIQKSIETCDPEYGYIIKIYKKFKIISNNISSAGIGVFFNVRFAINCLKPICGNDYIGKIILIFPTGIFVEIQKKIKVLIVGDKLKNYKYNTLKSCFENNKNDTLKQDDEINIIIDSVKYENKKFICIGNLKSD
jgi:DNA-directed RNA polymerase subunit E'/Rpb7